MKYSRCAARNLSSDLRSQLMGGRFGVGEFLPSERTISERHSVAPLTARRALKALEAEGLILAERRRGYRVLAMTNDPLKGRPIAFVMPEQAADEQWWGLNQICLGSVYRAAMKKGWPLLGLGVRGQNAGSVIKNCREARAWGMILNLFDEDLIRAARTEGLPVVMIDDWDAGAGVDTVVQDDFHGGYLTAQYLLAKGHRNIIWVDSKMESAHQLQRQGGVLAAFQNAGLEPRSGWIVKVGHGGDECVEAVRMRLAEPDRPTAALALWRENAVAVAAAAKKAGLRMGEDLEVVGWCAEPQYSADYAAHFSGGPIPATVVWSPETMAEVAVARLLERKINPAMPATTIRVDVRLRDAGGTDTRTRSSAEQNRQLAQMCGAGL